MTEKKSTPKKVPPVVNNMGAHVEHSTFNASSAANEHTRAAVIALASAAEANARAISDIASSLKGSPAYGLYLSDVRGS